MADDCARSGTSRMGLQCINIMYSLCVGNDDDDGRREYARDENDFGTYAMHGSRMNTYAAAVRIMYVI